MRLAVTADLHWGLDPRGDAASRDLARAVEDLAPDAFAIAGDVGEGEAFAHCLALFERLECDRLVVPGNHDVWARGVTFDSLELYESELPRIAAESGFHYLDQRPYHSASSGTTVVGSINWYDYSFADPAVLDEHADAPEMYRRKLFPTGVHNDGRFVRFGLTDEAFTERVVGTVERQLRELPDSVERVVVIQHHPPVRELFYPTALTSTYQRFWLAYTGNRRMQEVVLRDPRIRTLVCGHTHATCEAEVAGKRCLNIGGDYHFKRLLLLDTETGEERWWEFRTA